MEQALNQIMEIAVNAVVSILVIVIPILTSLVVKFIKTKLVEAENKIGEQNYKAIETVAEEIYFIVEQKYLNGFISDKAKEFNDMLLKRVPTLTQDEIDDARDKICGKINTIIKQK